MGGDPEGSFLENRLFSDAHSAEQNPAAPSDRLKKRADRTARKADRAREKIPQKTEYSLERIFDEKTGRARYVLTAVHTEKTFRPDGPVKRAARRMGTEISGFAHGKVAEAEKENAALEGAHKTEQKIADVSRYAMRHRKDRLKRKRDRARRLEKRRIQTETAYRYRKFLEENPDLEGPELKKRIRKRIQKQRLKREYAKALRAREISRNTKEAALRSAGLLGAAVRKIQEIVGRNVSLFVTVGVFALLLIVILTAASSCGAMFSDGINMVMAGSYQSLPAEIDAADLVLSELEADLQIEINEIETDYPDYDEYRYNLAPIGHDPFVLVGYLSAVHTEFEADAVRGEIETLFDGMYELTMESVTETRTRVVTKTGVRTVTDPETGEETEETYEYEEEEEYTVTILEVTLTAADLEELIAGRMDEEQAGMYELYASTRGLLQRFYSPLDMDWYSYVGSYYGYRVDAATGRKELHRGMDISVPTGTQIHASMDGTVTEAAYDAHYGNYIVITNREGYCTKYAHLDSLGVGPGQEVSHGDIIGTTGNTGNSMGSHLHLECLHNGEYYNPLFYFESGAGLTHEETGRTSRIALPSVPADRVPQILLEEAASYLGRPFVWGGSSPETGFDCSGFVCWVFTNSGVRDLPRDTAQGLYEQCAPVSAEDARAGDLIFFTGTYRSEGAVSHVGIYCGDGMMIHCGDPVKYASVYNPYWQSHFYGFGRLAAGE